MLISTAYAQTAGGAGGMDMMIQFAPMVLIVVVFYFLLIRPQQKRAKEHREMLANVRRGDRIVTNGGLFGTIAKVDEDEGILTIEVADGVRVQVLRSMLAEVRGKGQPVAKPSKKKSAAKDEPASKDEPAAKDEPANEDAEEDKVVKS